MKMRSVNYYISKNNAFLNYFFTVYQAIDCIFSSCVEYFARYNVAIGCGGVLYYFEEINMYYVIMTSILQEYRIF